MTFSDKVEAITRTDLISTYQAWIGHKRKTGWIGHKRKTSERNLIKFPPKPLNIVMDCQRLPLQQFQLICAHSSADINFPE